MAPKDAVTNDECEARVTRIHDKLDAILDRLARIEERQGSMGGVLGHAVAIVVAFLTALITGKLSK